VDGSFREHDLAGGFMPALRRVLEGETQGPAEQPAAGFAETVAVMEKSALRPSIDRVRTSENSHFIAARVRLQREH
jgi:hypothetical protein